MPCFLHIGKKNLKPTGLASAQHATCMVCNLRDVTLIVRDILIVDWVMWSPLCSYKWTVNCWTHGIWVQQLSRVPPVHAFKSTYRTSQELQPLGSDRKFSHKTLALCVLTYAAWSKTGLHCELELTEAQKVLGIFCLFLLCMLLLSQLHEKTGSSCFWEKDVGHDTGIVHTCQCPSPMHASWEHIQVKKHSRNRGQLLLCSNTQNAHVKCVLRRWVSRTLEILVLGESRSFPSGERRSWQLKSSSFLKCQPTVTVYPISAYFVDIHEK